MVTGSILATLTDLQQHMQQASKPIGRVANVHSTSSRFPALHESRLQSGFALCLEFTTSTSAGHSSTQVASLASELEADCTVNHTPQGASPASPGAGQYSIGR